MFLKEIINKIKEGVISTEEAEKLIRISLFTDLKSSFTSMTTEFKIPEILYGIGKSEDALINLIRNVLRFRDFVIISRVTECQVEAIKQTFKDFLIDIYSLANIVVIRKTKKQKLPKFKGKVAIFTSGTAEIAVAEEARIIAEELGCKTITEYGININELSYLYNLLKKTIAGGAKVFIIVTGKDSALPVIISNIIDYPVIGVPVSMGHSGVLGTLITMLQANAPGLAVVDTDNGVGAAIFAISILKLL